MRPWLWLGFFQEILFPEALSDVSLSTNRPGTQVSVWCRMPFRPLMLSPRLCGVSPRRPQAFGAGECDRFT